MGTQQGQPGESAEQASSEEDLVTGASEDLEASDDDDAVTGGISLNYSKIEIDY